MNTIQNGASIEEEMLAALRIALAILETDPIAYELTDGERLDVANIRSTIAKAASRSAPLPDGALVSGRPGTPMGTAMAAFDLLTTNVCPAAWMRGVTSYSGASDPPEHDAEFCYGDDRPGGDGWLPLYRLSKLEDQPADVNS